MSTINRSRSAFGAGLVAMTVAVLVALVWRVTAGVPTLPELMGDQLVALIPGNLFELGIQTFGPLAKKILFVLITLGQIVVGGGLAVFLSRTFGPGSRSFEGVIRFFGRAAVGAALSGGILVVILAGTSALADGLAMLVVVSAAFALVLAAGDWLTTRAPANQGGDVAALPTNSGASNLSRRGVLVLAATAATAAGVAAVLHGSGQASPTASLAPAPTIAPSIDAPAPLVAATPSAIPSPAPTTAASTANATPGAVLPASATAPAAPTSTLPAPVEAPLAVPPGTTPQLTPVGDFYKVSKNFLSDPRVEPSQWHLSIDGLVNKPIQLSLADLRGMPAVEKQHTLTCISNEVGGDLIGNAAWKGVGLGDLIRLAGAKTGVRKVVLTGADGYSDSITLERAMDAGTVLAYDMDGAPLQPEHGFPLRLLVPNIYGMKNLKWITKIELVNSDYQGYWQRGGWSDPAPIKTMSRIDVAKGGAVGQPVSVAGIGFAGQRGVSAVQISDDGGKTWQAAEVKSPNTPNIFSIWVARWIPKASGTIRLLVRAVDGTGEIQTSKEAAPFPDGASGWHSVDVKVS